MFNIYLSTDNYMHLKSYLSSLKIKKIAVSKYTFTFINILRSFKKACQSYIAVTGFKFFS